MSLLILAASARLDDPDGRRVDAFLRELSEQLPGRFALAVALTPPLQTQPELAWDWVTLPASAGRELQLSLLASYAAWLQPKLSLFSGNDAPAWLDAAQGSDFGERRLLSEFDAPEWIERCRDSLPAVIVLDDACEDRTLSAVLRGCSERTPLSVHSPKALGPLGRERLNRIMEIHAGPIRLVLPLKYALLRSRTALSDLAFIFKHKPRIELAVCDELGTPVPFALNRAWSLIGPRS